MVTTSSQHSKRHFGFLKANDNGFFFSPYLQHSFYLENSLGSFAFSSTYMDTSPYLFRIRKSSNPNRFTIQSCHTGFFLSSSESTQSVGTPVTSSHVCGTREIFRKKKGAWSSLLWGLGLDRLPLYFHPDSSLLYCGFEHSPYRLATCPPRLFRDFLGSFHLKFERKMRDIDSMNGLTLIFLFLLLFYKIVFSFFSM